MILWRSGFTRIIINNKRNRSNKLASNIADEVIWQHRHGRVPLWACGGGVGLTRLTLDLFAGPACGVLSALREFLVGTSLASHVGEPLVAEVLADFAVGECLGDVAVQKVSNCREKQTLPQTYPSTPMLDLNNASVRLGSL